jgi:hypothetical protein
VPDIVFLMRLLPKVQGSLLTFFGECIRNGDSWEQCKARVLKEYFPLFVREKMIREMVVFHFQGRECPLIEFIKDVVGAAEFLQFNLVFLYYQCILYFEVAILYSYILIPC